MNRGGKISIKNKTVFALTIICMFFVLMGTAFATGVGDVDTTDNSNLAVDSDDSLSANLGVSSDSVSNVNVYENNLNLGAEDSTKNATSIDSSDLEMYYRDGSEFRITLLDENNNLLSGQKVIFTVNEINYTVYTNNNGVAALGIGLPSGNVSIVTTFEGTDSYLPCNKTNTISIKSTIVGSDLEMSYKDGSAYQVTATDNKGKLLTNTLVMLNINGVLYNTYTNNNRVASLPIGLRTGEYIITATNSVTGESTSNKIKVLSTINGSDLVIYYKNGSSYSATFLKSDGSILANTIVQMNINGVLYNVRTNSQGVGSLPIGLLPGEYIITSTNPSNGEQASNRITVLSTIISNDLVKYYQNGSAFTVKIVDGQGNPLNNAKVQMNINGVLYNVYSNSEGLASLPIGLLPGKYIITSTCNGLSRSNFITVIDGETKVTVEEQYVYAYEVGQFNATLTYANGEPIKNRKLTFNLNGVNYYPVTNNEGVATLDVKLNPGDYPVTVSFNENNFKPSQGSNILHEVTSTVLILAEDMTMTVGDGSSLSATLVNIKDRSPIANHKIGFTINGVTYYPITDNNGVASLPIGLLPGKYLVTLSHSGYQQDFSKDVTVTINKAQATVKSADVYTMYKTPATYNATFYDREGNPLAGYSVTLSINGVNYNTVTNSEGTASLGIGLPAGNYTMTYTLNDNYYGATGTNIVFVNGTKFVAENIVLDANTPGQFKVVILDVNNKPVQGIPITFNLNNGQSIQNVVTNNNGEANAEISGYNPGTYNIVFSYTDFDGEEKVGVNSFTVKNPITVYDVIKTSIDIQYYIETNYALPGVIVIDDEVMNLASFYYLTCEAITSMNNGYFGVLSTKFVEEPDNPGSASYLGNLYTFVDVAQRNINYMDAYSIAPESIGSDVGDIGYDGLVYAMVRAVAFYDSHGRLPHYTVIKSFGAPVIPGVLNKPNTISDLGPYLAVTLNCQVDDPRIQSLANQLTSGLGSDYDKAQAIYNFVRDNVAYSFYYNTQKGAVRTLTYGNGNCCDQAHLVIALSRAAGLPARYNHGTCSFSSGTYGHVWAQILVGDTWVVADPTSTRNSFGVVNNWNNYNYALHGQYAQLSF